MEQSLQDRVQKRLSELPIDVREAIQSADLSKKIRAIGQKYELHIDQEGSLEDEVLLVMLGFADPGEFDDKLAQALAINPAQAATITTDVVNDIFIPIRESMKKWAEERAKEAPQVVATSTAAPKPAQDLAAAEVILAHKQVSAPAAPVPPSQPAAADTKPAAPATANASASMKAPETAQKSAEIKPQPYKADPYREPVE